MQQNSIKVEVHNGTPQTHPETKLPVQDPTTNEKNSRFKSDIQNASILNYVYFIYVWRLIKAAFLAARKGKMINVKDLITFPWARRADVLAERFTQNMAQQKKSNPNKTPSLSKAILWTMRWYLLWTGILETGFLFVRIFSAWVIKKLIDCYFIAEEADQAWKWAGILAACVVVAFHLEHHFNHIAQYTPNYVQYALISLIYAKITKLSSDALTKISPGRLINMCTNGVNLFEQIGMFTVNVVVGIIGLIAGGALIWQYFGVFTLVGLGYIVFWFPWQQIFIMISLKERDRTNVATANRIRMTSETIEAIRLLKMYTWEMNFKEKIEALRKVELKMLKKGSITSSLIRGLSFSTQICSTFLMFMSYSVSGHTLRVGEVFSAYFIIGYLRLYSSYLFGLALNFLTDARILINPLSAEYSSDID